MTARTSSRRSAADVPQRVRIIGGQWRRTLLPVADVRGLRPTPDRVRETVFNWLAHLLPEIEQARGIDLFAGTGALGFELASRGAKSVLLVETNAEALRELRTARDRLRAASVEIVDAEGLATARRQSPASFDVVFIDPPFDSSLGPAALAAARRIVTDAGFIYYEAAAPLTEAEAASHGLELVRTGRAGRVAFHLLRPASA